ncbi:MAG TPA: CDP-alcohol phosphatidyltransferase family protein [Longimicrobiaceae bacterium]|nr:CDP-alcohol phosphatidyltransferase family protein [Longimicrobiaceae bacterium]
MTTISGLASRLTGPVAQGDARSSFREAMRLPANQVTALRLLSIPVLWALALLGHPAAVGIGAAAAGLTDAVDGRLARRTHTTTRFGSAFDSVADHLLSASLLAWLVLLRPEFVREELPVLLAWGAFAVGVLAVGWIRFRRLGGLHLYSAKASSILCYLFGVALLVTGEYSPLFFYVVVGAATFGAAETLLVLLTRSQVDENVGSILRHRPTAKGD